jgi:hypothetical protein
MTIKGHPNFFGPTGKYPKGKLDEDDRGELRFAIMRDGDLVRVEFGSDVSWLGLPPETAVDFAKALLDAAGVKYEIAN